MGSQLDIERFAHRLRAFIDQVACEAHEPALSSKKSAQIGGQFEELALQLFGLQFEYNSPYGNYCRRLGRTPTDIEHWSQVPALPTAAFKEFELTCLPPQRRTTVFHSSGTTAQQPSRHFHSLDSLAIYEASLLPWFRKHLLREPSAMRIIALTPASAQAPRSSLAHMFEVVIREFGAPDSLFAGRLGCDGAWELDQEKLLRELKAAVSIGQPVLLLGTAFLFVHLVKHFERQSLRFTLPAASRLMETGGYKGRSRTLSKPKLYSMLTERLGIGPGSIVGEYGMSELSSQAYDLVLGETRAKPLRNLRLQARHFQFPPWARVQIVSPETGREVGDGERGLLRVFDLANAWSVMAVQTEDIGIKRGSGFELIGRAAAAETRGCSLMSADSL